ncbi:MAG TPA: hypothetical protein VGH15_11185 [Caulobacteraceae bacterium]|jgi:hypothetical protein
MSDIKWNAATNGDFATAANWAGGVKPGPADNAILDATGAAFAVTSSANEIVASIQTVAEATLDITGGNFDVTSGSGAGANAGLIDVAGTGRFRGGGTLHNSGTLEANAGGRISLAGVAVNTGGVIDAAGGSVLLQGVDIIGGTLASSTGHRLVFNKSGGELDGSSGHAVTVTGTVVIADGRSESAAGSLVNKGRIGLAHKGGGVTELVVGTGGLTLSGGGKVVLTGSGVARIDTGTTGDLINVDNRIVGGGTIGSAGLTLVNETGGFITSGASGPLVINTGANVLDNAGYIEGRQGGTMITGAVNNTGSLIAIGGSLTIEGAVTGSGQAAIYGGTLTFGSTFNENVRFNESSKDGRTGGELVLADSVAYSGTISGFSKTNSTKLDLRDIAFSAKTSATFSNGVLTVTDGTHIAHIKLAGDFTGSKWTVSGDGTGGTIVVDPASTAGPSLTALTGQMAAFSPGHAATPTQTVTVASPPSLAVPAPN